MWGLFAKMFGSEKALEKTVDAVSNGLDKLVYTDEEKAGDAARARSEARAMLVEWMQATQGQRLARRFLAVSVTSTWLLLYLVSIASAVLAVWLQEVSSRLLQTSKLLAGYSDQMSGAVLLILGFYFAAPHLGAIVEGALSKFSKTPNVGGKTDA